MMVMPHFFPFALMASMTACGSLSLSTWKVTISAPMSQNCGA